MASSNPEEDSVNFSVVWERRLPMERVLVNGGGSKETISMPAVIGCAS